MGALARRAMHLAALPIMWRPARYEHCKSQLGQIVMRALHTAAIAAGILALFTVLQTGGASVEACGGQPCPTPTPVATSTPVVQTIMIQQSQSQTQTQTQQQVQYASNWIVTQTCGGTIQHNTATGAQHRIDARPAPGCESRNQPSRAVPTADNRAYVGAASFTTTTTYSAPVRIAPPKTGSGGLK